MSTTTNDTSSGFNFAHFYGQQKHALGINYMTSEFLYPTGGPWPQPSFDYPYGLAPEIDNVPADEEADWEKYVASYYMSNALGDAEHPTPFGIAGAHFSMGNFSANGITGYDSLDDKTFVNMLCEGLYSKYLTPLDPSDLELFDLPATSPEWQYFKSDFSCMKVVKKTWPHEYAAPTITVVKRSATNPKYADEGGYQLVAIALAKLDKPAEQGGTYSYSKDMVFTPSTDDSTPAWWLLKYFALQGAIHRINLVDHVRVHFPTDVVNSVAKSVLPRWHPLLQLLMPHLWLHLPVDNAVLEGPRSLINRNTWYPWSPFVARGDEVRKLLPFSWAGDRFYNDGSNTSYPTYGFPMSPQTHSSPGRPHFMKNWIGNKVSRYAKFQEDYYAPIFNFVKSVVTELFPAPPADPLQHSDSFWLEIQHWAHEVSEHLPEFPGAKEICEGDTLATAVAMVIWNDAVGHSADHSVLHKMMDDNPMPFVLRVPPPASKTDTLDESLKEYLGDTAFGYFKGGVGKILDVVGGLAGLSADQERLLKNLVDTKLDKAELSEGTLPLCWPTDLVYAKMADLMFYRPHNCSLLYDCVYEFEVPKAEKTKEQLKLEASWKAEGRPLFKSAQKKQFKVLRAAFQEALDAVNAQYYHSDGSPVVPTKKNDTDTAGQMNKWGFPKIRPGTKEQSPKELRANVRMESCIGAGIQY